MELSQIEEMPASASLSAGWFWWPSCNSQGGTPSLGGWGNIASASRFCWVT